MNTYKPRFEALTDKEDMLDLYQELEDDQDLSAFGRYERTVAGTVYNALNRPNTYVIIAYGPNDEVWGITTGIIEGETAQNWWVIRAKHDYLQGFGTQLRAVERDFLVSQGVSVRKATAETEDGRRLILSTGATPFNGSTDEYMDVIANTETINHFI